MSQIRLDISEVIKLPNVNVKEIQRLDLNHNLGHTTEKENVTISGFLTLNGSYTNNSDEKKKFDHSIPVHIVLSNKKLLQPNFKASIESFDYTLNSSDEICLDAVLMLDGIGEQKKRAPRKKKLENSKNPLSNTEGLKSKVEQNSNLEHSSNLEESNAEKQIEEKKVKKAEETLFVTSDIEFEDNIASKALINNSSAPSQTRSINKKSEEEPKESLPKEQLKSSKLDEEDNSNHNDNESSTLDTTQSSELLDTPNWIKSLLKNREETFKAIKINLKDREEVRSCNDCCE